MSHLLPRFTAASQRIEDERKIGRIVLESRDAEQPRTVTRATLPGDMRRLRGIPIACRGVGGVSPGTDPLAALLRSRG
jgi:hypothetical protein